jgi:hypothetical protein
MSHNCPGCQKVFVSAKNLSAHIERTPLCTAPTPENLFGAEIVEPMLANLQASHIATLVRHPEDAICSDLVNLIFFNIDFPENSTILMNDNDVYIYGTKLKDGRGAKWRPLPDPAVVLRALARHFAKFVDSARAADDLLGLGALEVALATEYVRAIDGWTNVAISRHCPYFHKVEDGKISLSRMMASAMDTVRANLVLDREDWVLTEPYALNNLSD